MPEIKKNESEKSYISRCVSYLVKEEGKSQQAALGQCYGMYRQAKKKAKGTEVIWEDTLKEIDFGIAIIIP
ncbi:MAG: hypothetical protein AABY22_29010 [Nanoarchaeota archaeon]